MIRSRIMGTGHYLPPKVVTNYDVTRMMETNEKFIVERTGVLRRRHAEADVSATDLGAEACHAAVADAGVELSDVDLLIMNTITPDHHDPGCGFFLQAKLDLPPIAVLDIKQQCAGFIYALSIADHFVRGGTYRNVLICCAEVLSKRIDGSYDGRNLAILLGDGAGAAVIGPADPDAPERIIQYTSLHAEGQNAKVLYSEAPGTALGKMDFIDKDDLDAGRIHFRMQGQPMFQNGVRRMAEAVTEALEANGLTLDDIDLIVPHQPNLRMLEGVVEAAALPTDKVFLNVEEYGNIASASLPLSLDQVRKSGRAKPGDLILMITFGSGFVWGSAIFRL